MCIELPAGFVFDTVSVPLTIRLVIAPSELGVIAPLVRTTGSPTPAARTAFSLGSRRTGSSWIT